MAIFCSTVIPTIGRSSLDKAVESVFQQEMGHEAIEIIVVNDSGKPLPPADWQHSPHVILIHTNQRERSIARNTGAAMAHGRFLHFLDDDDWLEPGAMQHFWELSIQTDAAWLYGSSQLVDRQGRSLIQLHHRLQGNCFLQAMAGEWIPLQASLIENRAFFNVGGFNPLLSGPEDIDLLRRIGLHYNLAGTAKVVANITMGEVGSTTDYVRHPEISRWAREQILDEKGVFHRLQSSITPNLDRKDRARWHGRILRLYLTSAIWNLKHHRLWSAIDRSAFALAGIAYAGSHLASSHFWRSLWRPYASDTFARGIAAANRE